jgi:hypothetical protein
VLDQRDLDLLKSDAQIDYAEVKAEFMTAFLGGRNDNWNNNGEETRTDLVAVSGGEQIAGEQMGEVEPDEYA